MQAVGTLLFVAAALLGVAGVAKVLRPLPAASAMSAVGLPSRRTLVRILGIFELALAAVVIVTASPVAVAVTGGMYLAFTWFVAVTMRSATLRSCGCFGESAAPPGITHIVVNLAAAAVCGLAVALSVPPFAEILGGGLKAMAALGGSVLAVYLVVGLLTAHAQAMRAVVEVGRP